MRTLAIFKFVFTGTGAVMLAVALVLAVRTSAFIGGATTAQGTVIDLVASRSDNSTTWRPVVRFAAADGRPIQFEAGFSSNPPMYSRGEKVEVLYSATNPRNASIKSFVGLWIGPLIVGGLGAVFFTAGAAVWLVPVFRARRDAQLRVQGTPIQTKLQGVERNTRVALDGVSPYRIATQWQDPATGEVHVFRSEDVWFDPSDYVKGRPITVYVDPANPRRYWVDTSFLPRLAA